jgi:protein-S-isoprenylcysteine O-methyltransferase Ste14
VLNRTSWTLAWIATGLLIGEIVLLIVGGGGDIAWLRYAGFALWALSAVFGWVPMFQFKRHGGVAPGDSYMETTRLVETGLYAIVRHPQFVAWPMMSVAVALVSQHLAVIVMGAGATVLACLDLRAVDEREIEKFGDAYRDYMERVPGWNFVAGLWRWVRRRGADRSRMMAP